MNVSNEPVITRVATLHDGTEGGAVFSADERHRYTLWRVFGVGIGEVAFLMLNPSTATHIATDPTVTRCANFAKAWGYGGFTVVNLFSLRATDPKALKTDATAEGDPENLRAIIEVARRVDMVVCAWGVHGALRDRDSDVVQAITNERISSKLRCLGETKAGAPRHPLYLPSQSMPIPYYSRGGDAA